MSDSKHTSEPWELHPDYPNQVRRPPSNDAYGLSASIADCSSGIWPDSKTVANAARIVACVNACKGINPEAVPDLLAALQAVLDVPEARKALEQWGDRELIAARAAIAKAEGMDE